VFAFMVDPPAGANRRRWKGILMRALIASGIMALLWWGFNQQWPIHAGDPLSKRPLRVGITRWAGFAGGILANNGIGANGNARWKHKFGVEFRFLEDIDARETALQLKDQDGGVDVVWSSVETWPAEAARFKERHIEASAIMEIASSTASCGIVTDGAVPQEGSLLRQRLGAPRFTPAHWLANKRLQQIHNEDALFPTDTPDEAVNGFAGLTSAGKLFVGPRFDAVALCEPYLQEAIDRHPGKTIKLNLPEKEARVTYIFIARQEIIDNWPEELQDFVNQWLIANEDAKSQKAVDLLFNIRKSGNAKSQELQALHARIQSELDPIHMASLKENSELFGLEGPEAALDVHFNEFNETTENWRGKAGIPVRPEETRTKELLAMVQGEAERMCRSEAKFDPKPPLFFNGPGSAQLATKSLALLELLTPQLKQDSHSVICIFGYTGFSQEERDNNKLQWTRAQAVREYLEKHGVHASRLVALAAGPPAEKNKAHIQQGWENGRAEIKVLQGGLQ
jgi:outer membrane protein OmpA-like peptidoglycan-associated protein